MYKQILLVVCSMLPCLSIAKSDLTKQEKATMKALMKQYPLERVEVERPYDGFVYYNLLTKDLRRMIADSTGQVIIPQSRQDSDAIRGDIRFIRGHEKGVDRFRVKGRSASNIMAYYSGNEPVYVATKSIGDGTNEYAFMSTSGELLCTFNGSIREDTNSPVYTSKDMKGNYGLMSFDGQTLLPNVYTGIETRADGICLLYQMNDGIERMGGLASQR